MPEIYHYITHLPDGIKEIVIPCFDGFTVYTADWLSKDERIQEFRHAMKHIDRNDWEKGNVQEIEKNAHK